MDRRSAARDTSSRSPSMVSSASSSLAWSSSSAIRSARASSSSTASARAGFGAGVGPGLIELGAPLGALGRQVVDRGLPGGGSSGGQDLVELGRGLGGELELVLGGLGAVAGDGDLVIGHDAIRLRRRAGDARGCRRPGRRRRARGRRRAPRPGRRAAARPEPSQCSRASSASRRRRADLGVSRPDHVREAIALGGGLVLGRQLRFEEGEVAESGGCFTGRGQLLAEAEAFGGRGRVGGFELAVLLGRARRGVG